MRVLCVTFGLGVAALLLLSVSAAAQSIAILTPDHREPSLIIADELSTVVKDKAKILDPAMAEAAYDAAPAENPFNMTRAEARRIGAAIGCEAYIVLRSADQRRSGYPRPDYFDSYAAIFAVSSRTGRLLRFELDSEQAPNAEVSRKKLLASLTDVGPRLLSAIDGAVKSETSMPEQSAIAEMKDMDNETDKNYRPPVPYRRIKPEYTHLADLYEVAATVDLDVDLDENGRILRTEVDRWAGFGLDESVDSTVRTMNWRPAERSGRLLSARFLLRYNFKKLEK